MSGFNQHNDQIYGGDRFMQEFNRFESEVAAQTYQSQQHHYQLHQNQQHQQQYQQANAFQQPGPSSFAFLPHSVQRQRPREVTAAAGSPHLVSYPHLSGQPQQPSTSGFTVTPMGLPASSQPQASVDSTQTQSKKKGREKGKKGKKNLRIAGGQKWEDPTLEEWAKDDFRLFAGDLGNDVSDDVLSRTFNKYPSFIKAKVVRDRKTNKSKGYGFISFKDPQDFIRAMRDMNGKYVGSRPIKLRKSTWKDRNVDVVRKKTKERAKLGLL